MTYNVFSGTLNPTHSLTQLYKILSGSLCSNFNFRWILVQSMKSTHFWKPYNISNQNNNVSIIILRFALPFAGLQVEADALRVCEKLRVCAEHFCRHAASAFHSVDIIARLK